MTSIQKSIDGKFDSILEEMKVLHIPLDEVNLNAAENVAKRLTLPLGVSGKIASGKDSVAAEVISALNIESSNHLFARSLKDELSQILALSSDSSSTSKAALAISAEQGVTLLDATRTAELAAAVLEVDPSATGYSRGAEFRTLILCWANEIRRRQDPLYFVSRTLQAAYLDLGQGKNVHVSDVRQRNEINALEKLGFSVARVDVSPEVQRQRLMSRDGLEPDPKVIFDLSETDLDLYEHFALRVNNDGPIEVAVNAIATHCKKFLAFEV